MGDQYNPYAQYSLRGVLYSVVDNTHDNLAGVGAARQIIIDAIDEALDEGCESSDQIVDYILTSQYQYVDEPDLRFNAVLRASEQVGGHMRHKLFNLYHDLYLDAHDDSLSEDDQEVIFSEGASYGFALALAVMLNPKTVEHPHDPLDVDVDVVQDMAELIESQHQKIVENPKLQHQKHSVIFHCIKPTKR